MYRVPRMGLVAAYGRKLGNTVIAPRFKCAFHFENGKAKVGCYTGENRQYDAEHSYWESDGWYYIDKTGRKID